MTRGAGAPPDDDVPPPTDADAPPDKEKRRSHASQIVDLVREDGVELFHSPDRVAFATFRRDGHAETWSVKSREFGLYLRRRFYETTEDAPSAQAVADARATLEAAAIFDGVELAVHTRVAGHEGRLYLDLGNPTWSAVEVTPSGWRVVTCPPVRFVRKRGMLPLPWPVRGGKLGELRDLINADDDTDWILMVSWLLGAFSPKGPFPVLALHGEQGSGKSTVARMLRALIDANSAPIRSEPREARDLMIAASNGWVVALDNLSHLPPWLSDALCRLATGGGFATRELYTDTEEVIFDAQRPVILNGIEEVATRGDLLSRAIVVRLRAIPENRRRTEADLWEKFKQGAPRILGALLDAVACALRELPTVSLPGLPRMADFARLATAAEPALGLAPGAFLRAYDANRAAANELALEVSPIVPFVRDLVASDGEWTGPAGDLLAELVKRAGEPARRLDGWPKSPRAMAGHLRRLAPNLRATGLDVAELPREARSGRRLWRLRLQGAPASPSSPASPDEGARGDDDGRSPEAGVHESPAPPSVGDDGDACDAFWTDDEDGRDADPPGDVQR